MERAKRLRLVCGMMALVCLLVAAGRLIAAAAPAIDPQLATLSVHCNGLRCWTERNPVRLLAPEQGEALVRSPDGRARLATLLERPRPRLLIAAGSAVRAAPLFLMFLFLALAFRALGRGRGFDPSGIAWLRRAAAAALVAVFCQPVSDTLRATALSQITTGEHQLFIAFNGGPFLWGLLLAGAAWAAVWALEEARGVEAALAEIV